MFVLYTPPAFLVTRKDWLGSAWIEWSEIFWDGWLTPLIMIFLVASAFWHVAYLRVGFFFFFFRIVLIFLCLVIFLFLYYTSIACMLRIACSLLRLMPFSLVSIQDVQTRFAFATVTL